MEAARRAFQQELCDEATCPICLDYFKDPVIIPACGHNFCKGCLEQYWRNLGAQVSCPSCRVKVQQRKVTPNRPLANLVDMAKKLTLGGEKRAREERSLCDKHQEPQKLFCQDDKVLICALCNKSKEHRNHQVVPLEEAFEECKDLIMNCRKALRDKRKEVLSCKADTEKESQDLLEQVKAEREKTVTAFRQVHQVLEEREKLLLAQMEEVIEEVKRERENHLDKLEKERQSLESIIQEMEEKLQQPAVDLLQDIGGFMERFEVQKNCQNSPITFPSTLKWKIWDFCDINPFLEGVTKQFQDSLLSGLQLQKANVHLDPETAQPKLIVSEDCKSVRRTKTPQDVPDNPERFDFWPFVLGCEEFTAGRHFWEVIVGCEGEWSVGVAKKSVKRKGLIKSGPEEGIWYMGKGRNTYWSYSNASYTLLSLSEEPRKIRVALNYEGGRVAFYDADRGTLISAYSGAPFTRETLRPLCSVAGNAHLALSS